MSQVKALPDGWKWVKLGEVCKIHQGYGFPKDLQGTKTGEFPFYKVGDISKNVKAGFRYLELCDNFIDKQTLLTLKAKPYPTNTIVFAKIGEGLKLNRRAIIKKSGIVDNNAVGLKAIEQLCNDLFLFHFFTTVKLEDYSQATTVPSVRKSDIENISFPLPPLSIQAQIVEKLEALLSELDKGKAQLLTAQAQLKTYRQAVLKYAFEGKLTGDTEGWQKVKLGSLKTFSLYGPRFSKEDYSNNGVAVLRTTDISDWGKVDYNNAPKINLSNKEIEKYKILKNDLLITRTGSIGRISLFNDDIVAIPGAYLIQYRLNETVFPRYAFYFFRTSAIQTEMTAKSAGIGRLNLNVPSIDDFEINLPPLSTQEKIVTEIESRLSVCDKLEETLKMSLAQSETLRQSLLKRAFEGRLFVIQ